MKFITMNHDNDYGDFMIMKSHLWHYQKALFFNTICLAQAMNVYLIR